MLEFVISNYILFIVAAVVLLLGLFGYLMDKKKYKQYREEIVNEQKAIETFEYEPNIQNVATPVAVDNVAEEIQVPNQTPEVNQPEVPEVPEVPQS
ncbi:MAG: hypothetical protein HFI73_03880 [Bacilli bacterium]|jgi:hypothetical protein|nr:hypothetical protein [Bacilli bacterium]